MRTLAAGLRFAVIPLAIVLLVGAGALAWRSAPWLQALEGKILDTLFQVRGTEVPHTDTLVIAIDDRTVAQLGGWPIDRAVLADLITMLNDGGASAIGLDLLLLEPRLSRDGMPTEGDAALITASRASDRLVLPFAATRREVGGAATSDESIQGSAYLSYVQAPTSNAEAISIDGMRLLTPFNELADAVAVGHVTVPLEPDGAVRRWAPVVGYGDRRYPAMAVELARFYRNVARSDLLWIEGDGLKLGPAFAPTDQRGHIALNAYGPAGTFRTVSLADFLSGRAPPHMARNRIVLVGATATGVGDTYVTAFDGRLPGVELIATMTQNLLHGEMLANDPTTFGLSLALMVVFTALTAALAALRLPNLLLVGICAVLGLWAFTVYWAFARYGLWLDAVPGVAAVILTGIWVMGRRLMRDRRANRAAEARSRALSRFVAPALADRLAERDIALTGSHQCDAAVMFIDLVGFTKATEDMPAVETLPLLSRFYRLIETATDCHRGIVDKFIGDGAMALFGISEADRHRAAADAIQCALQLVADFQAVDGAGWDAGGRRLTISVGIHYGPVALAEIGGDKQVQFTATGDTVNVASRLEELTRDLATPLVVSNDAIMAARSQLPENVLRQFVALPQTTLRGRTKSMSAWALSETRPRAAVA